MARGGRRTEEASCNPICCPLPLAKGSEQKSALSPFSPGVGGSAPLPPRCLNPSGAAAVASPGVGVGSGGVKNVGAEVPPPPPPSFGAGAGPGLGSLGLKKTGGAPGAGAGAGAANDVSGWSVGLVNMVGAAAPPPSSEPPEASGSAARPDESEHFCVPGLQLYSRVDIRKACRLRAASALFKRTRTGCRFRILQVCRERKGIRLDFLACLLLACTHRSLHLRFHGDLLVLPAQLQLISEPLGGSCLETTNQ